MDLFNKLNLWSVTVSIKKKRALCYSNMLIKLIHNIHILLVHKSLYVSCETILPKSISLTYPQL
jgi:hypothetical protein